MKNIKSLIIVLVVLPVIFMLLPASCSSDKISPEELKRIKEETAEQQKLLRERALQVERMENIEDSTANAAVEQTIENLKDSIQIIKCQTTSPSSSVGGVDCKLVWKNKFKRTIKYIDFYVSAINGVGDEVYSELSRFNGPEKLSLTGPIKSNQVHGNGGIYERVWYNSDIKKCILREVNIEFMDGSKVEIKL